MLSTAISFGFVLGALAALFAVGRYARNHLHVSAEWSRKFVHIGMGIVCLTFPWLFSGSMPVIALAVIATVALVALRTVPSLRANYSCVLCDVERRSLGEFTFIAGIACTFILAHGEPLVYVLPVAVLTFADSVAALIGKRFGSRRFNSPAGPKSFEGSAAFFVVAVVCVAVPLTIFDGHHAILTAFVTGGALMLIEAWSWRGFDNFAIPVLGEVVLRTLAAGAGLGVAS
jgi:phytol kinase